MLLFQECPKETKFDNLPSIEVRYLNKIYKVIENGGRCFGNLTCLYGKVCCCGECYPSLVSSCFDGKWFAHYTDACFNDSIGCSSNKFDRSIFLIHKLFISDTSKYIFL